jgi:large subunit ribosomal protein L28
VIELFGRVSSGLWPWIHIGSDFMSRVCQLTGKRANNGMAVSHSHVRTKKLQQVNLQERRLWWAEGNRWVKLRVATRTLRTIQKKGLGAYARELGINLAKI